MKISCRAYYFISLVNATSMDAFSIIREISGQNKCVSPLFSSFPLWLKNNTC